MKRYFAAVFLLIFLLAGCGSREDGISISILDGPADLGSFRASSPTEESARAARALVDAVLAEYPAGFPDQWGTVEILLVGDLTGQEQFDGGHYAGFTQRTDGGWQMVLDAGRCDAGTVHHEIAHILDGILTDAGALTEDAWTAFCPGGFVYGQTGDYPDFFADPYAMTDIREDRARTFEEAILSGPGVYEGRPALWLKLNCFSQAIRDHFDTENWPEKTLWELALD